MVLLAAEVMQGLHRRWCSRVDVYATLLDAYEMAIEVEFDSKQQTQISSFQAGMAS